jgi:predicted site-specific integrase-resolvase
MTKAKRVAIYVRVSTDEQTTALQRRELRRGPGAPAIPS